MTKKHIYFTKMHGLGNDFLVVDNREGALADPGMFARRVCTRRTGVGADGLLLVENSQVADIKMRILNADGSEAQMCGNGIRCFARYVHEHNIISKNPLRTETLAGVMEPELIFNDDVVMAVRVNMGKPSFDCTSLPMVFEKSRFVDEPITADGRTFRATAVLMGVPHLIVPVTEQLTDADITRYGNALEHHAAFPEGTNVDFVCREHGNTISVRTWERGCGITLACGTGSCATAVAAAETGLAESLGLGASAITIKLAIGELIIERDDSGDIFMTGPAETVYEGVTWGEDDDAVS